VLRGSVRKAERSCGSPPQLVNVADGYDLWSERFDRGPEDVRDPGGDRPNRSLIGCRWPDRSADGHLLAHTETLESLPPLPQAVGSLQAGVAIWHGSKRSRRPELDPEYALASAGLADP